MRFNFGMFKVKLGGRLLGLLNPTGDSDQVQFWDF